MYYITEDINKNTCIKMVYLHEALLFYQVFFYYILWNLNLADILNNNRSLTQILMLGPVAAQSQYLLGLKHNELMMFPPSKV